jgi:hypothetical protein
MKETALEYERACSHLCDNIASALFALQTPTLGAASLAAAATRDLSDALHHAAGHPDDARWEAALSSLERFIGICERSQRASRTASFAALRAFLDENSAAPRAAA